MRITRRSIRFGIVGLFAAGFMAVSALASEASDYFKIQTRMIDTGNLTITATAVPEPASLLLMGTGLIVVAAKLRRRREQRVATQTEQH